MASHQNACFRSVTSQSTISQSTISQSTVSHQHALSGNVLDVIDAHPEAIAHPSYLSEHKQANRTIVAKHEEDETGSKGSGLPLSAEDAAFTEDEKFGLLSAFLDDEVSEEERCLVSHWLKSDASLQATYQQQLKLRAALKLLSGDL